MNAIRRALTHLSKLLILLSVVSVAPVASAESEGPYRMEVLINGAPVREYPHRGKTYVEARRGREYAVRLTNLTGERVAVALSIDGLNSIDAKHTSAADARKWILGPHDSIVVDGWQTSSQTARHFYFTHEAASYGAMMGDKRNLGNISAAFFREQRPMPRPYYEPEADGWYDEPTSKSQREMPMKGAQAGKSAPAAAAESAAGIMSDRAPSQKQEAKRSMAADDLAATGIGRESRNDVYQVEFRQESSSAAVMTVRYEYRETLVKLGVLPREYRRDPMYRRESSSGFTDSGFAPDPYRRD